jgi:hypothetical protein
MKKHLFSLFIILYSLNNVFSQACYLDLTTQTQVNAVKDKTCSSITHLQIYVREGIDKITDLTPLSHITTINGDLLINLGDLESIHGLNELTTITGNLKISGATVLTDLPSSPNAFNSLQSIGGVLYIYQNTSLLNISGFSNLREVGNIYISENNKLKDIEGINNIIRSSNITIASCNELETITGFKNLVTLDNISLNMHGALNITYNNSLKSIPSFQKLTNIISLYITENYAIEKISGFNNIKEFNNIKIYKNASLDTIDGFNGELLNGKNLTISDNTKLKSIKGFADLTTQNILIENNGSITDISEFNTINAEALNINGNNSLQDISGFNGLKEIKSITITKNKKLSAISGFDSLNILNEIVLSNNDSIKTLLGIFSKIEYSSITFLAVQNNVALSSCSTNWMCGYLNKKGISFINNIGKCYNATEILNNCLINNINGTTDIKKIFFYPNPCSNTLFLSGTYKYSISDMTGKILLENQDSEISTRDLNTGMYYITINGEMEKFIKD